MGGYFDRNQRSPGTTNVNIRVSILERPSLTQLRWLQAMSVAPFGQPFDSGDHHKVVV